MLKTNSILSENFLNAVRTAYTLHAELKKARWKSPSTITCVMTHGTRR